MDKLKELTAAMERCANEMEQLLGKVASAPSDEKRSEYHSAFRVKQAEFQELEGKVGDLKSVLKVQATLAEVQAFNTAQTEGKSLSAADDKTKEDAHSVEGKSLDTTQSRAKDEHDRMNIFLDYCAMGAKNMEGRAFDAISAVKNARNPSLAQEEHGVLLPPRICSQLFSQYEMFGGKVVLSTDATGGATDSGAANLLAPDFRAQLMTKPVAAPSFYDKVTIIPAYNGKATWPKLDQAQGNHGGVAFTWKATEGADKAETEPVFTDFEITTHELSGWTEVSLTALRRSSISLEATITQLFRDAARYEFNRCIMYGAGTASNQPQGIVGASGVNLVARLVANAVSWGDLANLEYAVNMALRAGAMFGIQDEVEKHLKTQLDQDDKPLFTSDTGSTLRTNLAGYGYGAHEYLSGAAGDTAVALGDEGDVVFGNFRQYGFALEEDIAIARSEHAEFKKGRVVFRLICFVGGKPLYPEAFSILDDAVAS